VKVEAKDRKARVVIRDWYELATEYGAQMVFLKNHLSSDDNAYLR